MRLKRLYKNWHVHNVLAHPVSHILRTVGLDGAADAVHDGTEPDDKGRVRMTERDVLDLAMRMYAGEWSVHSEIEQIIRIAYGFRAKWNGEAGDD